MKTRAILMIGTQRSGSNLLRMMLNQLDEFASPHPPHILQIFFPLLPFYGKLEMKENFFRLVEDVCHFIKLNPVPWNIDIDPQKIMQRCSRETLVDIFLAVHEEYAAQRNARFWCCKSMQNVNFISEIERTGQRPFYIHLYRDGRDVALSFRKIAIGEKHFYHIAKQWKNDQELALKYHSKLAPDRSIAVNYSELIHYPEEVLKNICSKVGLRYDSKALLFYESNEAKKMAQSSNMYSNLIKPIQKDNDQKYLNEATQEEIKIFESVAGDTLIKLGYKIHNSIQDKFSFGVEDINRFNEINTKLKEYAIQTANGSDMGQRRKQMKFVEEIKSRKISG